MQLKAAHVITNFHADGAQQALSRILASLGDRAGGMEVVALGDDGPVGDALRKQGIRVHSLAMRPGLRSALGAVRLAGHLRRWRPDVVVTWLYHGDLIGGLAACLAGRVPVVWNARRSGVPDAGAKRSTQIVVAACCKLARRVPSAVVFCSEKGRSEHVARGYPAERSLVIPNGFDLVEFRPRGGAAARVRTDLNLPSAASLVGHFGRFHSAKDHHTLLTAASRVVAADDDAHFVLCGRDVETNNAELAAMLRRLALTHRCHLLGHRSDVAELMAGMDVVVSSSRTEGFPNAVGEALACGVPCIGTDVGETRRIIGPGGEVVPPQEARTLAAAILRLLGRAPAERQRIGGLGRQHVMDHFEISRLAERHLQVWMAVATGAKVGLATDVFDRVRQNAA